MATKEGASNTRSEVVSGSHQFKIDEFSSLKGIGVGKMISSHIFTVGGGKWRIDFYPDGDVEDNALHISIFVTFKGDSDGTLATYDLRLLDLNGHPAANGSSGAKMGTSHTFVRDRDWGYGKFMLRSEFESSEYLNDDSLEILCTLRVTREVECSRKISKIPPSNLSKHLASFFESGDLSDITFEVEEETFQVHKFVLAARSPVFRATLFGEMSESNLDRMVIKDMTVPAFRALMKYMYTDELPEDNALIADVGCHDPKVSLAILHQHLLEAADRCALGRLKIICEEKLCDNITVETVATTLALAEQHNCAELKAACLQFASVPGNLIALMLSDGFKHLRKSCPSVLNELQESLPSSSSSVNALLKALHSANSEAKTS